MLFINASVTVRNRPKSLFSKNNCQSSKTKQQFVFYKISHIALKRLNCVKQSDERLVDQKLEGYHDKYNMAKNMKFQTQFAGKLNDFLQCIASFSTPRFVTNCFKLPKETMCTISGLYHKLPGRARLILRVGWGRGAKSVHCFVIFDSHEQNYTMPHQQSDW